MARLRATRTLLVMGAVAALALGVSACAPEPEPAASSAPPSASASPAPVETPTGPVLVPEGTAEDNLPLFTEIVRGVWSGPDQVSGRAYIDALTAAGFDRTAMQVTEDTSTVGNPAESIQFAVRWGDECLIGQVGPATGEPVTVVMPGLQAGGCLIGNTRAIDW